MARTRPYLTALEMWKTDTGSHSSDRTVLCDPDSHARAAGDVEDLLIRSERQHVDQGVDPASEPEWHHDALNNFRKVATQSKNQSSPSYQLTVYRRVARLPSIDAGFSLLCPHS